MPSLGSALAQGMNRSGCRLTASAPSPDGSPTPINPLSTPQRSISRSVTPIGSVEPFRSLPGTSLKMYSTGNSNSSFDSRSLVWRVMKR
jgi:hypothetical protein